MAGRSKRRRGWQVVAIEICHSDLRIAVYQITGEETINVSTSSLVWREKATTIHSDTGKTELATALKRLVTEYRLQGAAVHLTLGGEYCVTRVVTGSASRVRHELDQLEQRSSLYLSLGHGQKALGGSIRQIDARHQHALLTIVNQKTLDALVDVAGKASIDLRLIEPSLVALSRLVGHMGRDADNPVLIIDACERGVEVGISHRGQLLLDYRPAGHEDAHEVAEIVGRHLGRLQRYCDRYVRLTDARLERAIVCGASETAETVRAAFVEQGELTVEVLDPAEADRSWRFTSDNSTCFASAVLGTCLTADPRGEVEKGPNLLEGIEARYREPLPPALARTAWPIAAVLLVALASWVFTARQQARCVRLQRQIDHYEIQQQRARILRQQIVRTQEEIGYLTTVASSLRAPAWHGVASRIGQCLPEDVWLDSLSVDGHGLIAIRGASYSDDGVFEFVKWLKQLPAVDHVALGGTRPTRVPTGPATHFELTCDLVDHNDWERSNDGGG